MDGIIIVNKEKGFTSHDVVAKLRGILHMKKIGHTGTLDPDATGVLPVCVGRATKVCDVLTDRDKTYEAEVVLGITTDTLDTTGEVLTRQPVSVTGEKLREVLSRFHGEITQIPPMYSAVKVNGKKLYEYAREGKDVERKERRVTIHELTLLEENLFPLEMPEKMTDKKELPAGAYPSFRIRIKCSKGTYIRTLCDDIGRELGCGAAMASLERTAVGRFTIDRALTLAEIEASVRENDTGNRPIFLSIDSLFDSYPAVQVSPDRMNLLKNGNPLFLQTESAGSKEGNVVRVYGDDGHFYALYRYNHKKNCFTVEKYFG